jgi:hypothetical protein
VSESVVLLLGLFSGSSISVKASAVLPYDNNNPHPRILLRAFWSTAFSEMADAVPYREIRILQGWDNDNIKPLSQWR